MTLGNKINSLRTERGLSQKELATLANVTTGTIAEWEADESAPSLAELARLSKTLNVSSDVLLEIPDEEVPAPAPVNTSAPVTAPSSVVDPAIVPNPVLAPVPVTGPYSAPIVPVKKRSKSKKIFITILVSLLSVIAVFVNIYGYWFFTRTPKEKVIDKQLKGTTWTIEYIKFSNTPAYVPDYIPIEELGEDAGTLLRVEFHPIFDKVTLVFNNGSETIPYRVTDFNSVQLTDDIYNYTVTFYEDVILSVSSDYWTYFSQVNNDSLED